MRISVSETAQSEPLLLDAVKNRNSSGFSKWDAWQTRFTAFCFASDKIYPTKYLNFAMSPFAISALLYMLYLGANGRTKQAILKILNLKKKDVDKMAEGFEKLLPLYEKWKNVTPSNLFLAFDAYVNPGYQVDNNYEEAIRKTFGKEVQKLDMHEFLDRMEQSSGSRVSSAEMTPNEEASMVGVAIAAVEAAWDAIEVYEYSIQPFETHYGMKREQEYILIRARLRCYKNLEHECWCIPLRAVSGSKGDPAEMDMFLIRPRRKGEVYALQKSLDESKLQEILFGMDKCKVSERTILVPQILLPFEDKDKRLTDMLEHWKQLRANNQFVKMNGNLKMDYCLHYTSMTISRRGVGFMFTPRQRPITSFTQTSQNPYHVYPSPPDEPFAIRYDTPFLFIVYERTYRLPLIIGCYAGEPSIARALLAPKIRMKKWKKNFYNCCHKPQVHE